MRVLRRVRVTQLQVNLAASFAGKIWTALMGLAFVPIYVHYLGIEAYGLIGFFAAFQALAQVLDLGLTPTLNRELARLSALPQRSGDARDLVRTLEVGYWAMGGLIGVSTWMLAPFIAGSWIHAESIHREVVEAAVRMMGIVLALQWPLDIYYGGLMGLQRQALANGLRIVMTSLASVGAAVVLARVSSDVLTFFAWQAIVGTAHVVLVLTVLWRSLPQSDHSARFSRDLLRGVWKFAAGMTGIAVTSIVATQLDKVILSGLLSLEMFGYYTLGWVLASGIRIVAAPAFDAFFPRFSALIAQGDEASLRALYHRAAQLVSTLIIPMTGVVSLFSYEIVRLWTGSPATAVQAAPVVAVLAVGMGINGVWVLPYALQLAWGRTSMVLALNVALIAAMVPALLVLTQRFGSLGAASTWAMFNALGLLVGSRLAHGRLLHGEWSVWAGEDVVRPTVGAIGAVLLFRLLVPHSLGTTAQIEAIVGALGTAVVAAALLSPRLRSRARALVTGAGPAGR